MWTQLNYLHWERRSCVSILLNSSRIFLPIELIKSMSQQIAFLFAVGAPNSLLTWENSMLVDQWFTQQGSPLSTCSETLPTTLGWNLVWGATCDQASDPITGCFGAPHPKPLGAPPRAPRLDPNETIAFTPAINSASLYQVFGGFSRANL